MKWLNRLIANLWRRSRYSSPSLKVRIDASLKRISVKARFVATEKYERQLAAELVPNIEQGVTFVDGVLAQFHWTASKFVEEEQVDNVLLLPGPKHSLLGMMAIAFDLADDDFEDLCKLLHSVHAKNAKKYRQYWNEAHDRQSQKQEAERRANRRRAEAERVNRKAVAERYRETDPTIAYDSGCRQLAGRAEQTLYALLPYGVERARAAETDRVPDWTNAPRFEVLSATEVEIVTLMVRLLANLDDDGFELEILSDYPQIAEQAAMFVGLAARFSAEGDWPSELPYGSLETGGRPQWLDDIFENVMAFFVLWGAKVQDEDLPH